jgi:tRNA G18 (ribose-2'-O)-methylase SpoU
MMADDAACGFEAASLKPVCKLDFPRQWPRIAPMLHIQSITSLDLPELAPYRTLKRSVAHARLGIFVVEGDKVLDRLLESDFPVVSVLIVGERLAEYEPRLRTRPEKEIAVYVCPKPVMEELTGFEIYQGVLAIAQMPAPLTLENILALGPRPRLFVALDGLSNAENVGLLMRNCAAFGVTALITGETCCSPFLRRTVRNSMGTIFKLPVMESPDLVKTLSELRAHGVRCLAAHPHTEKKFLPQADFTGDVCVVFGSEGHGISPAVLAACDEAVAVPMANEVDSLNVSAAAAVFLYEANRQRGKV